MSLTRQETTTTRPQSLSVIYDPSNTVSLTSYKVNEGSACSPLCFVYLTYAQVTGVLGDPPFTVTSAVFTSDQFATVIGVMDTPTVATADRMTVCHAFTRTDYGGGFLQRYTVTFTDSNTLQALSDEVSRMETDSVFGTCDSPPLTVVVRRETSASGPTALETGGVSNFTNLNLNSTLRPPTSANQLSEGAKIGIGIGVTAFAIFIAVGGFLFALIYRHQQLIAKKSAEESAHANKLEHGARGDVPWWWKSELAGRTRAELVGQPDAAELHANGIVRELDGKHDRKELSAGEVAKEAEVTTYESPQK